MEKYIIMVIIETQKSGIAMNKKILATALALLLSAPLLLAGCGKQDPNAPSGFITASNDCVEYHLYVPDTWIVDTAEDSMMISARASDTVATNISMIAYTNDQYEVKKDEKGNSISPVPDYFADYKTDLEKIFDRDKEGNTTFKLNEDLSGKTRLVGGEGEGSTATGYTYVYTGAVGGTELMYMQVIIYRKETFYLFTYTSVPGQYDQYIDDVEDILAHIEFPEA